MTAYARVADILPCPDTVDGRHDWTDARQSSDQLYSGECGWCAALLVQRWFGWEFFTGEEHFDHDAWSFDEILRVTRPRRRVDDPEDVEAIPMRFDPIPINIGQNTRAIYRPQELGAPEIDPLRPAFAPENFNDGPLVRFFEPDELNFDGHTLQRVRGGENWGIYADQQAIDNAINRAEQAPRRGQYAQAFVRGLRAAAAQHAVEGVLNARICTNVGQDWEGIEVRDEDGNRV